MNLEIHSPQQDYSGPHPQCPNHTGVMQTASGHLESVIAALQSKAAKFEAAMAQQLNAHQEVGIPVFSPRSGVRVLYGVASRLQEVDVCTLQVATRS